MTGKRAEDAAGPGTRGEAGASRRADRDQDATARQVHELVPRLPFGDDPMTFQRALAELADRHGLEDEV